VAGRGDLACKLVHSAELGRGSTINLALQTALQPESYNGVPILRLARPANDLPSSLCRPRGLALLEFQMCGDLWSSANASGRSAQLGFSRAILDRKKKVALYGSSIFAERFPVS
jgi:hypothetical protein